MATPITAGAGLWEVRKLVARRGRRRRADSCRSSSGMVAALVSGLLAIAVLLRYLRTHAPTSSSPTGSSLAAVVVVAWLGLWDR